MNVLYFMIPIALLLGLGFVISFIWAAKKGQYDDLETPAFRMLFDDQPNTKINTKKDGV